MLTLARKLRSLRRDDRGQGMSEYIIIVILVAVVLIAIVVAFRDKIASKFNDAGDQIENMDMEADP